MKKNELFPSVIFFVLIVCFLSTTTSIAQSKSLKQENSIIGEWFPLNTSKGGLGVAFDFTADGNVICNTGAYIAVKYKLEGDTLISFIPNERQMKQKIEINNTKLIFINKDKNTELTRMGGDTNSGIIGKWIGDHYTGAKQILYFTPSQNEYLTVPMTSNKGTYKINGDIVEFFGETNRTYKWSIEDNTLTLKENNSEMSLKYLRLK